MSTKRRGPRGLDPGDRALWDVIKKTIRPLRGRKTEILADWADAARLLVKATSQPPPVRNAAPAAAKSPPPLATLDRRARSRVARGRVEIDARLDLHGLTLERARDRLSRFLHSAQASGASLVLVITGKGASAGNRPNGARGALRREVPHWLSSPELRPLVIGFEEAAQGHGGAGALYVRIRRLRS